MLYGGYERGSSVVIARVKVIGTLVMVADAGKVTAIAARSSDMILEVTYRGGGVSGV